EEAFGHVELPEIGLEVDVQPLDVARPALLDRVQHEGAADAGPLVGRMDHDVEQEGVTAAVGDDVAEPDQLRPAAGGDPAKGVALEPLGPGRDAPVAVEARRVQRGELPVVDLLAPGEAELRLLVPLRQGAEGLRLASRFARAHQLESFRRADPLWAATWSVLSLRISYCGSSSLARRVWPLYSKSSVWTSVIVPETCPASEFQLTWSPTANFVLMRGLLDSRAPSLTPGRSPVPEQDPQLPDGHPAAAPATAGDPGARAVLDDLGAVLVEIHVDPPGVLEAQRIAR